MLRTCIVTEGPDFAKKTRGPTSDAVTKAVRMSLQIISAPLAAPEPLQPILPQSKSSSPSKIEIRQR
ncbi:uncharacterized protein FOMMEDRAFT_159687 [Fomitiporia mediterranea MF3/22]|uniref:uncharacterized protein n=1 Tax=Fomitiporia mediterranea (strain MF3/22) TaxID=694068 RepID=UPI0004409677|nr:uncharacterized protein FOMMEDRAFT_159687 [Fomitiporia mediterranea MF3/22]EJD00075.1 hypothetical protein FOMMEDRAFT_159687 [Fomitiporia mediterranea MF3/22]